MRKYIIALLLLLSIFCYVSCSTIDFKDTDIEYLIKQNKGNVYQKDLLYFIQELKRLHPAFTPNEYAYVYDDDFKKLACETYNELGQSPFKEGETEQNTYKFCYLVTKKLLAKLKDGHTYFNCINTLRSTSEPTIPIIMKWFENELYVIDSIEGYESLINKRITKINSVDAIQLKPYINDFISGENDYFKNNINGLILCRKNVLELLNLVSYNKVEIEYIDNGEIKTEILELKKWKGYKNKIMEFFKSNIGRKEEFFNENNAEIWYREIKEYSVMYVQANAFMDKNYFMGQCTNFLQEIKDKSIRNIIIDLRSNSGGYPSIYEDLIGKYINLEKNKMLDSFFVMVKPSKEWFDGSDSSNHDDQIKSGELMSFSSGVIRGDSDDSLAFHGNLYVLVGGMTLSGATIFSGTIKDNKLGMLIGEPTGNASTFFVGSNSTSITLPNLSIPIEITCAMYVRNSEEARLKEPDAVYPDIYIPTTFEDYTNGKDPCWEYLVENVFSKQED